MRKLTPDFGGEKDVEGGFIRSISIARMRRRGGGREGSKNLGRRGRNMLRRLASASFRENRCRRLKWNSQRKGRTDEADGKTSNGGHSERGKESSFIGRGGREEDGLPQAERDIENRGSKTGEEEGFRRRSRKYHSSMRRTSTGLQHPTPAGEIETQMSDGERKRKTEQQRKTSHRIRTGKEKDQLRRGKPAESVIKFLSNQDWSTYLISGALVQTIAVNLQPETPDLVAGWFLGALLQNSCLRFPPHARDSRPLDLPRSLPTVDRATTATGDGRRARSLGWKKNREKKRRRRRRTAMGRKRKEKKNINEKKTAAYLIQ